MANFKLNIADPKEGKCYKTEVKDDLAAPLMGLNIGEKIEGNKIGIDGYEFEVTGGSDFCGFPMRRGILGIRKKLVIEGGIGYKGGLKGMRKRKTVCGHKINEKIAAVNLKITKAGSKNLAAVFGGEEAKAEKPAEKSKEAPAEKSKEAPKQEAKAEKPAEKSKEAPAEEKKE